MVFSITVPNNKVLTFLYVIFLDGCEKLQLTGFDNIYLRARIMIAFDTISIGNENNTRVLIDDNKSLEVSETELSLLKKCMEIAQYKTIHARVAADTLTALIQAKQES